MGDRIGDRVHRDGGTTRAWVEDGKLAVTEWRLDPGARWSVRSVLGRGDDAVEGAEDWVAVCTAGAGTLRIGEDAVPLAVGDRRRVGSGRHAELTAGEGGLEVVCFVLCSLAGRNLAGARLAGRDLSGADLAGSDLTGADLTGADLEDAILAGADLSSARLVGIHAPGVDLAGARLSRADLSGADLRGGLLAGADLTDANLARADLRDADLTGAALDGCDLTQADLREADCRGATLSAALRDHTRIDAAVLDGTGLENE